MANRYWLMFKVTAMRTSTIIGCKSLYHLFALCLYLVSGTDNVTSDVFQIISKKCFIGYDKMIQIPYNSLPQCAYYCLQDSSCKGACFNTFGNTCYLTSRIRTDPSLMYIRLPTCFLMWKCK